MLVNVRQNPNEVIIPHSMCLFTLLICTTQYKSCKLPTCLSVWCQVNYTNDRIRVDPWRESRSNHAPHSLWLVTDASGKRSLSCAPKTESIIIARRQHGRRIRRTGLAATSCISSSKTEKNHGAHGADRDQAQQIVLDSSGLWGREYANSSPLTPIKWTLTTLAHMYTTSRVKDLLQQLLTHAHVMQCRAHLQCRSEWLAGDRLTRSSD